VTASSSSASTTTTSTSTGLDRETDNIDESSTNVNLLWSGTGSNVFAIPRLAIDAFVTPQVTFGGSAGYMSQGGSTKTASITTIQGSNPISTNEDNDLPDVSAFVLSPRVGLVVSLGPQLALWLRGGLTYFHTSVDSTKSTPPAFSGDPIITTKVSKETSGTAATLDAQLVFVPIDHVGITIGPLVDIGLGGSTKTTVTITGTTGSFGSTDTQTTTTDGDLTQSNYGVAGGILAFF
jgi:hypothetical protein